VSDDLPDIRIECTVCHETIYQRDRKIVGEVLIPGEFLVEHCHSSEFLIASVSLEARHIRGDERYSLCERVIEPFEWTFVDVDHARAAIETNARIQPCGDCYSRC